MVKSILRAQSHFHHIGKTLLALLGGGDLRRDEAVRDGQQAGGVFAQHLRVGKQGKAFHLHAEAAALIPAKNNNIFHPLHLEKTLKQKVDFSLHSLKNIGARELQKGAVALTISKS